MADAKVHFDYAGDQTGLTLELFAEAAPDTIVNGTPDACTQLTNNKGTYEAIVDNGLTGWHKATVKNSGGIPVVKSRVWMTDDTSIHEIHDAPVKLHDGSAFGQVNQVQISGDGTAADNAEAFFDGTGYAGTNNVIPVVGSVTGAVGSVTGAVGSVTGSVASVTGAVGSVTGNLVGNVVGSVASVTGAVGSVTGAVGSVAGNVGGNVVGSVASVTADVGITQAGADKAWSTAARVLTAGTNIALAKGTGVTGFNDLSAAQVNAEADTALADYDGPTNAEMESRTILAASYSTLTAAQVNAEADTALADYDGPTNAEMVARTILAASYSTLTAAQVNAEADTALADYDAPTNAEMVARTRLAAEYMLASSYTAPPTVGQVRTELETDGSMLEHLHEMTEDDAGTRRFTENALEEGPTGAAAPTAGDNADAVWDELRADHVLAGSFGLGTPVSDKTGFKLASDGLDSISTTAPAGVAANFREMVVQTWRRFFKKTTKSATELKTYADDGVTVRTTQTYSSVGSDETVNSA